MIQQRIRRFDDGRYIVTHYVDIFEFLLGVQIFQIRRDDTTLVIRGASNYKLLSCTMNSDVHHVYECSRERFTLLFGHQATSRTVDLCLFFIVVLVHHLCSST